MAASVTKSQSELVSYTELVATNQMEIRVIIDSRVPNWIMDDGTWDDTKVWKDNEFWID